MSSVNLENTKKKLRAEFINLKFKNEKMENFKKIGAPKVGENKKIQFRISVKQKIIDSLGEEFIREICEIAILKQFEKTNQKN